MSLTLQELSLLQNGTQLVRKKLGINSAHAFVEYVAKERQVSIDDARTIIRHSPKLMALMFAVA
jgi:hypothetical protein